MIREGEGSEWCVLEGCIVFGLLLFFIFNNDLLGCIILRMRWWDEIVVYRGKVKGIMDVKL